MSKIVQKIFLLSFLTLIFLLHSFNGQLIEVKDLKIENINQVHSLRNYQPHDPIIINNNSDFEEQGWLGEGTSSNPYLISGYVIESMFSSNLIEIQNTNVYLEIKNCWLKRNSTMILIGSSGIALYNVSNAIINNNTISFSQRTIRLENSENITITHNKVINHQSYGIQILESVNNVISDNMIVSNGFYGIYLDKSSDNKILNNIISESYIAGISVNNFSNRTTIQNNTIFVNTPSMSGMSGIKIYFSQECQISTNTITNMTSIGIRLYSSNVTLISDNYIQENNEGLNIVSSCNITLLKNRINKSNEHGILIESSCNNTIQNNSISSNTDYGLILDIYTNMSIIKWNNFIQNYNTTYSQAYDNGSSNIFVNNHWNEWIEPDDDSNDIVDLPYSINGSANNEDPYPLVIAVILLSDEDPIDTLNSTTSANIQTSTRTHENPVNQELLNTGILLAIISSMIIAAGFLLREVKKSKVSIDEPKLKNLTSELEKEAKTPLEDTEELEKPPFYTLLFVPFIWLFAQILYPPQIRKLSKTKVLNNPIRKKILQILEHQEFNHFEGLKTQLGCGVSILLWHLQVLKDFKLIKLKMVDKYKVYHLARITPDEHKILLSCSIRSQKAIEILTTFQNTALICHTIQELANKTNITKKIIRYHCEKLVKLGVLTYSEELDSYRLTQDQISYISWLTNHYYKKKPIISTNHQ